MKGRWPGRFALLVLVLSLGALGGCDDGGGGGVGFSVGLPASYGSMELGLSTTQWMGGPTW